MIARGGLDLVGRFHRAKRRRQEQRSLAVALPGGWGRFGTCATYAAGALSARPPHDATLEDVRASPEGSSQGKSFIPPAAMPMDRLRLRRRCDRSQEHEAERSDRANQDGEGKPQDTTAGHAQRKAGVQQRERSPANDVFLIHGSPVFRVDGSGSSARTWCGIRDGVRVCADLDSLGFKEAGAVQPLGASWLTGDYLPRARDSRCLRCGAGSPGALVDPVVGDDERRIRGVVQEGDGALSGARDPLVIEPDAVAIRTPGTVLRREHERPVPQREPAPRRRCGRALRHADARAGPHVALIAPVGRRSATSSTPGAG